MNFENCSSESNTLSRLALLAKETPHKHLSELDRPLGLPQEKRPELPQRSDQSLARFESFSVEEADYPSRLAFIANELPSERLDVNELDRPMGLTQETRQDLPPLSDETRERLQKGGYPERVLDAIGSEAEAGIYENANLEPAQVNGKDALVRTDIDYDQKDALGRTNLERMKAGLAPLDTQGKPIELHHIGQKQDSPLAELTCGEHRGKGNDNVLHDKLKESEINREDFNKERQDHWKARAEQIESGNK